MTSTDSNERRIWMATNPNTTEGNYGYLGIPEGAQSIVVLVYDREAMYDSARNRPTAEYLRQQGIATLMTYLLTLDEAAMESTQPTDVQIDLGLLTERLVGATDWLLHNPETRELKIGYFGTGVGGAAALIAAAARPNAIQTVVSRGGRIDLAQMALPNVKAPTLLIVGANDSATLPANRQAADQLPASSKLEVVPEAGHMFEEPGTLDRVMELAHGWFSQYLKGAD